METTRTKQQTAVYPKAPAGLYMYFWMFTLGGVLGMGLEGLWHLLHWGTWENHPSLVWGPFCIIYGMGVVAIYIMADLLHTKNIFLQSGVYMLAGALIEYFASLFQELCFGSASWDYSTHFLNIGGRVSLKMTLLWGVLGSLFAKLLYPVVKKMFSWRPPKAVRVATILCIIFMLVDIAVSSAALLRWEQRQHSGIAAHPIAHYLDVRFPDGWMQSHYPNMRFVVPAITDSTIKD